MATPGGQRTCLFIHPTGIAIPLGAGHFAGDTAGIKQAGLPLLRSLHSSQGKQTKTNREIKEHNNFKS